MFGFDTNDPLTLRIINGMRNKHPETEFIIRYVGSGDNIKNITRQEVDLIMRETTWSLVLVYETNPVSGSYFHLGEMRGREDGLIAAHFALAAGVEDGAIYSTVDYDAPSEDMSKIIEYQRGFDMGVKTICPRRETGVYGSGYVCNAVRQKIKCLTWRSLSTGWRGYGSGFDLEQHAGGSDPCSYDLNESDGHAGGWRRKKTYACKKPDNPVK